MTVTRSMILDTVRPNMTNGVTDLFTGIIFTALGGHSATLSRMMMKEDDQNIVYASLQGTNGEDWNFRFFPNEGIAILAIGDTEEAWDEARTLDIDGAFQLINTIPNLDAYVMDDGEFEVELHLLAELTLDSDQYWLSDWDDFENYEDEEDEEDEDDQSSALTLGIMLPQGVASRVEAFEESTGGEFSREMGRIIACHAIATAFRFGNLNMGDLTYRDLDVKFSIDEDEEDAHGEAFSGFSVGAKKPIIEAILEQSGIPMDALEMSELFPAMMMGSIYLDYIMESRDYDQAGASIVASLAAQGCRFCKLDELIAQSSATTQEIECPSCRAIAAIAEYCEEQMPRAEPSQHLH